MEFEYKLINAKTKTEALLKEIGRRENLDYSPLVSFRGMEMAAVAIYVAAPVSDLNAFQQDCLAQALITVSAEVALQISQNSQVIFEETDNSQSLKAVQDGLFAGQAFVGFLAHFERSDIVQSARIVRQAHLLHGDMTDEELVSWTQNLLVVAISALNEPISDLQKNPSDFNP